ncbi:MAG: hypothetical protein COA32_14095 [Fluviicola sp.]|nr:MAG: hypothetical protein COA32_14095 [Fluviicola sp.]
MENQELENEKPKRPTFLVVLAVLSYISIGIGTLGVLFSLISGPISQEQLEQQEAQLYESINVLNDAGMDDFVTIIETSSNQAKYINNEVFYSFNIINLLSLIIGFMGVFLMMKLKKVGFHLYVAYSLLPIIIIYALIPMNLIIGVSIIASVILSAIFCILYGLNLKHME